MTASLKSLVKKKSSVEKKSSTAKQSTTSKVSSTGNKATPKKASPSKAAATTKDSKTLKKTSISKKTSTSKKAPTTKKAKTIEVKNDSKVLNKKKKSRPKSEDAVSLKSAQVFHPEVLPQKALTPSKAGIEKRAATSSQATTGSERLAGSSLAKRESDDPLKVAPVKLASSKVFRTHALTAEVVDSELTESQIVEPEILDETFEIPSVKTKEDYSHLPSTVTDGLSLYLSELRKYPLLTKEQEIEVAQRYALHHDPKDAEILVTANLRFVVKVAAEYARFGSRLIDLIQEGNVGLMHAVKEFNPYKGVRLITYAVWWIRGYIQEYLMRQYSMVRIGTTQNQRKLFYRLDKEREKLAHEGLEITPKLLSARLGVTEDEVNSMQQRLHGRDISLDQPLDDDSTGSLLDFEAGTDEDLGDQLAHRQSIKLLHSTLEELRPSLNEKEKELLDFRLLNDEPKKLQEIGDQWGVTREAVRQMEVRLMKKIKGHFEKLGQNLSKAIEDE